MSTTDEAIRVEGEVVESLPNTLFRVRLDQAAGQLAGRLVLCYLSGKMRKYYIRIMPGDKVRIEITPYDKTRGRIVFRL